MNEFSATNHYYSEDRERYERRVSKSLEDIAGELTQTNFLLQQILIIKAVPHGMRKLRMKKCLRHGSLVGSWFTF